MTRLGTVRYDHSASFPIREVMRCFGGLFAELATYPDRELLRATPEQPLAEHDTMLASLLRRRWHQKVFEMYAASDRVGPEVDDVRVKFDLSTPLQQAEADVLRSPGDLCMRALALHRRLESTFETIAGSVNDGSASEFMHAMAEVEAKDQKTVSRLANECATDW